MKTSHKKLRLQYLQGLFRPAVYFSFIIVILAGCTSIIKTEVDLKQFKASTKHAYTVGIYYSPEFKSYVHYRGQSTNPEKASTKASVGPASHKALQHIIHLLFEEVVVLEQLPEAGNKQAGVDFILEPSLEWTNFYTGLDRESKIYSTTFRFTAYTPEGIPFETWTITGMVEKNHMPVYSHVRDDIQSALQQFMQSVGETNSNGEIHLGNLWVKPKQLPHSRPLNRDEILIQARMPDLKELQEKFTRVKAPEGALLSISVKISGHEGYRVYPEKALLQLPDGTSLKAICSVKVVSLLDQRQVFVGSNIFSMMLAQVAITKKQEILDKLLLDLQQNSFMNTTSTQTLESQGLLYFQAQHDMKTFQNVSLKLWIVDPKTLDAIQVEVPVENIHLSSKM